MNAVDTVKWKITPRNKKRLPDISDSVSMLTPYAVETRYPGYWEEVTEYDVNDAIETAAKVLVWAKDIINS